ncbi:MAG TPA: DUF2937 family protein [Pseudolabrys sp.]|nr:DUF2937 family protein [Pseudolabrys sp.]
MRIIVVALGLLVFCFVTLAASVMQQYHQRIGGAAQELTRFVSDFDANASASNMTRQQALTLMFRNAEPFIQTRATTISRYAVRLERLKSQADALAGPLPAALVTFIIDYDRDLLAGTMKDYRLTFSASGMVLGFVLMCLTILFGGMLAVMTGSNQRSAA